jgi:hypothetical protein
MKTTWTFAVASLLCVGLLAGCKSTATPNLSKPGDAKSQQKTAAKYDPYPSPDLGMDMSGTRPRGYERPYDEATQAQIGNPKNKNCQQ